MKALITGASSGIGKEIAIYLDKLGYQTILVANNQDKLEEVKKTLKNKTKIVVADLANEKSVKELCIVLKQEDLDILVNNAGFGTFGYYDQTDLFTEMNMIDVNLRAVHILTKMFLKAYSNKKNTYIMNVSSSAGLLPGGPLMATYYATKSYVTSYSLAIYEELRRKKAQTKISVLCPGPVNTNFNNVAGVQFGMKALSARYTAEYAINKMLFKDKTIIVPGFSVRLGVFFARLISRKTSLKITFKIQKKKEKTE